MRVNKKQGGFTLLELIVVVVVIGVLMATSLKYYGEIVDDARKAGLQMLSSRFSAAVSNIHLKWVLEKHPDVIHAESAQLIMNRNGWPVAEVTLNKQKNLNSCQQLWQSLFQNPAQLPDIFPGDGQGIHYWAELRDGKLCRYHLVSGESKAFFFDYHLNTGKVVTNLGGS